MGVGLKLSSERERGWVLVNNYRPTHIHAKAAAAPAPAPAPATATAAGYEYIANNLS